VGKMVEFGPPIAVGGGGAGEGGYIEEGLATTNTLPCLASTSLTKPF
jgi:hypothetical protein